MLIGFLYAMFATAIITFELSRKKRMLFDQLSVLNIFFLANIVGPAAVLHLILDPGFEQADRVADFSLLGYLYYRAETTERIILFLGSLIAYWGLAFGYKLTASGIDFSHQTTRAASFKLRL